MQQTINFAPAVEQQNGSNALESVRTQVTNLAQQVNTVLDSRSDFYSRLIEEDITWRQALRAGIVLPLMIIIAIGCVMTSPLVALLSLAIAGWVACRVNKADGQTSPRRTKNRK